MALTNFNITKFQDRYTFFERHQESSRILQKYPERVPVICERNSHDYSAPYIDKNKYLVPLDTTLGEFIYVIRKRLRLNSHDALFVFINGQIIANHYLISSIYNLFKNDDGFLYMNYARETTFG